MKNLVLKIFFSLLVLISFNLCFAQDWEKSFYQDLALAKGFDVVEVADGGYVLVGEVDLPTGAIRHHIWAVKTDQDGNELWSHIFDYYNVSNWKAKAVVETSTGDLLIAGADGFSKASILKLSADGDSLWTKFYGGNGFNDFNDIIKTESGNFIVVGQYEAEANSQVKEAWAMGIDVNGDSLWSAKYFDQSAITASAMDISYLSSVRYLISGHVDGEGFAIEIDGTQGQEIWAKTYQLSAGDILLAGVINNNGDALLLGGTSAGFAGNFPSLIQTDLSGNLLNTIPFMTVNFGAISDLVATTDGGYILTGSSYDFWNQTGSDIGYISKLDAALEVEWEISYEDSLDIQGAAIKQTSDGGYIMAGSKQGGMFLKKIGGTTNAIYNFSSNDFSAKLYPNPTTDRLIIEIPEGFLLPNMSVRFYDAHGRLVGQEKITSSVNEIAMARFSSGFYQVVIFKKEKELVSGKIIVR